MAALNPIKPKKKPKPKKLKLANDEFCWYDGEETLTSGVTELFVCVDDETPSFELLDDGTYTLESGVTFDVFEGVYTI